ncbi:hypothetical protein Q0M94_06775 [Deinococcus radiomollis]|uniref:hypothetical protein n=1 Tax=Deinococcus radiomollis TaxID=468916 RepID=UPI003892552B
MTERPQFLLSVAACLTLGLTQSGLAAGPTVQTLPNSSVVTTLGSTPGWFVCDSLSGPTVSVMGWPDARGLSRLTTYSKANAGQFVYRDYRVGGADVGAGQIHYPLSARGLNAIGRVPNAVGSFNTGALGQPEQALTPNIVTLDSGETTGDCRWTLNTRLLGFDARRSFMVTEMPGGQLRYQTFDFADPVRPVQLDGVQRSSVPSLSIVGGRRTLSSTLETFTFQNAGYTYTVRVARQGQPAGASVTVSRGGQTVQTETLTGYTYAVRR